MKATVFLIAVTIMLVSGQAPNDIDETCRRDHPYNLHHHWIPYVNDTAVGIRGNVKWQVILDQYDYLNILGQPGALWTSMDFDGDGLQVMTMGCYNVANIVLHFSVIVVLLIGLGTG